MGYSAQQTIRLAVPMQQLLRVLKKALIISAATLLAACKHPLEIQGQGDIIETAGGVRGCSLEEFQAGVSRCLSNAVDGDEDAVYRALPRPGWRFSHWDGGCAKGSTAPDCNISYLQSLADFWDQNAPDQDWPALKAVFVQDGDTLAGTEYIAAQFGGIGGSSYAALLDALFYGTDRWRFTTQQATRPQLLISRREYRYDRRSGGLVGSGVTATVEAGAATREFDYVALADTEGDDTSVTFYMPKRSSTPSNSFQGNWYCGHISTRNEPGGGQGGYARFFTAALDSGGGGTLRLVADRWDQQGTSNNIGYTVFENGTAYLDYLGLRLAGSISADGDVFVGSEISDDVRGVGACLRRSSGKGLDTVSGTFYGVYVSIAAPLFTAVAQRDFTPAGGADLTLRRDSYGGSNRQFGDFVLTVDDQRGQLETGSRHGAISPDGQVVFFVDTRPSTQISSILPSFSLYFRSN